MSKEKKSKTDAIGTAVGIGALSQLSRNKRIRSAGDTLLIFTLMVTVSELIKCAFKWIIFKPCVFAVKLTVKIFVLGTKATWYIYKFIFGLIKVSIAKLIEYIRSKKAVD